MNKCHVPYKYCLIWNYVQAVGDAFNDGLYEEQARLRGIPLLESRPKNQMRKMTAKEGCRTRKVSAV